MLRAPARELTRDEALPHGQFRFNDVELLGEGGLGRVDKIRITLTADPNKPIGSEWARKRLNSKWAANPEMRTRLDREINALKQMSHPNIVTLEGENLPGNERFYVMPVYESSVRKHVASGNWKGKWKSIAECGASLADALHYAHGRGFIHRDLKPDNILFNPNGPLVVSDWGLGYFVHRESKVLMQLTRGGMGTEYYCSMEQWASGKCDERGDIYSLGMTLDEWSTGRQRAIKVGHGINGPAINSQTRGAARFNQLLVRMTQLLPYHRPASMAEVAAELRAACVDG